MKNKIVEEFYSFTQAKKNNSILLKLVLLFSLIVVIVSFVWTYKVSNNALNKVVVVERSGEYLKTSAESSEKLFKTLIKTTCSQLVYYANSFDRLTIKENQAKANFYCNKESLQPIFKLYKEEKSYHEALERGVIYKCELEEVTLIGSEEPYNVVFSSILTIIDKESKVKFRIMSSGTIIKTSPQYPENITGFFFTKYEQSIKEIEEQNENDLEE